MIDPSQIASGRGWRLVIDLRADALLVAFFHPQPPVTLQFQPLQFSLPSSVADAPTPLPEGPVAPLLYPPLKPLEEVIYSCPTLLLPELDSTLILHPALAHPQADIRNFLHRSFPTANWLSSQALLSSRWKAPQGSLLANIRSDNLLDIIIAGDGHPLLANSFEWQSPLDILYYVMASRQALDIPASAPVFVAAAPSLRVAPLALLHQYVANVMPATLPPSLASLLSPCGNDPDLPSAPFHLLLAATNQ